MKNYINEIVIVTEFLNNFFSYKDLADYLCIPKTEVVRAIKSLRDPEKIEKVIEHKKLVDKYYSAVKNNIKRVVSLDDLEDVEMANYIIETHCSIRECAEYFKKGKTTVYEHIHNKLPNIDIVLYKEVFDVLMENKSIGVNNKQIIEMVMESYDLLLEGKTIEEISEIQHIGWNVVERNLTRRLSKIDKEKAEQAKKILSISQRKNIGKNGYRRKK